jgi:hypothetical protein
MVIGWHCGAIDWSYRLKKSPERHWKKLVDSLKASLLLQMENPLVARAFSWPGAGSNWN